MLVAIALSAALSGQVSDNVVDRAAQDLTKATILMAACEPHTGPGTYREFRAWLASKAWRAPLAQRTDRAYASAKQEYAQDPAEQARLFTADFCAAEIRPNQTRAIMSMASAEWDLENPNAITRGR